MKQMMISAAMLLCLSAFLPLKTGAQTAHTLPLPANLYRYHIVKDRPYVFFQTRERGKKYYKNNGTYGVIDLRTGNTLWSKKIKYANTAANFSEKGILQTVNGTGWDHLTTHLYALDTGEDRYKLWTMPVFINSEADIMLGYKNFNSKLLTCFRLSTGEKLWETMLPHHNNETWNNIRLTDPDHLLFSANNLCLLNIKTGGLNYYESKTAVTDVKTGAALGALAVLSMAFAGMAIIPTSGNVITSLTSNVASDSAYYYFSDRNQLSCLDHHLNEVWHYDFPAKTAAHAQLFTRGDTLYMLNEGYGLKGGRRTAAGKPFMARFDKTTGRQLAFDMLPEKWDEERLGKSLTFVPDTLYLLDAADTTFTALVSDGETYPLYAADGNVCMVNKRLEVVKEYNRMLLYHKGPSTPYCQVLGQWGDSPDFYIVDNSGKGLCHFGKPYSDISFSDGKIVLRDEMGLHWLEKTF